jgi:hypothetical protein
VAEKVTHDVDTLSDPESRYTIGRGQDAFRSTLQILSDRLGVRSSCALVPPLKTSAPRFLPLGPGGIDLKHDNTSNPPCSRSARESRGTRRTLLSDFDH